MRNPLDLWRGDSSTFRDMNTWSQMMDRVFRDAAPWAQSSGKETAGAFLPACEVTEDKAHFYFKFDLPGLSKDQVKIELHDNLLTVTGERKEEKKEDSKRYHFSETSYGTFLRTFTLPTNVDAEKVEAKFENGVLNIAIAKTEVSKARQINIK